MHATCCICFKQISNHSCRDIFDETLLISPRENNMYEKSVECIKLRDAIELIIGYKVSKIDNATLCEACFQNVESYIKFRSQLVGSLETLYNKCNGQVATTNLSAVPENVDTSQVTITFNEEPKTSIKEDINVNNISSSFHHLSNNENESSDFSSSPKPLNDQGNDNRNDSDSSNDNSSINISQEYLPKIQDMESEIDVCSGKDDEILEFDVQYNKDISASSSSESDAEECDYEPATKRMKHYTACSSVILL